jgi:hypothetical protein
MLPKFLEKVTERLFIKVGSIRYRIGLAVGELELGFHGFLRRSPRRVAG